MMSTDDQSGGGKSTANAVLFSVLALSGGCPVGGIERLCMADRRGLHSLPRLFYALLTGNGEGNEYEYCN